jgi:hypothetical protein
VAKISDQWGRCLSSPESHPLEGNLEPTVEAELCVGGLTRRRFLKLGGNTFSKAFNPHKIVSAVKLRITVHSAERICTSPIVSGALTLTMPSIINSGKEGTLKPPNILRKWVVPSVEIVPMRIGTPVAR